MSQELISFSAQKVKVKALRGNLFELVVNVRTNSGGNYDFTTSSSETDNGYFQVFNTSGAAVQNNYLQGANLVNEDITWSVTVEDGKLTIRSTNDSGFWPRPGTYRYSLFTEKVDATQANSELTYWLYGDFVVVDDNPASALGGFPTGAGFTNEG